MVTSRELAHISTAATYGILFEKDGSGLLTWDVPQLRRWPVELSAREGRERVCIGPPQQLLKMDSPTPNGSMTFCGPVQKRLAIVDNYFHNYRDSGVSVIDLAPRPRVVQSWRTPTACFIAASPDGRWVATGSFEGPGFLVRDTLRHAPDQLWSMGDAHVAFSPDGRWFVSGTGGSAYTGAECIFWRVGTWERGPSIPLDRTTSPSDVEFSDDGRMLVVERTMTELLLLDPHGLRELARLQSREPMLLSRLRFSPDGGLLVVGTSNGFFHLWDLRQIRARLKDMRLDWNLPPIGPPPDTLTAGQPLEVEGRLDLASLVARANYYLEIQDYRRALADFEEALARDPDQPEVSQRLAQILTDGPLAIRDPSRASELSRQAARPDAGGPDSPSGRRSPEGP
jgi:hypothetical protein